MRCDRTRPHCSHCIAYAVDCTYLSPSRKARARKRHDSTKNDDNTSQVNSRLRNLEDLVQQLSARVISAEQHDGTQVQRQTQQPEESLITTTSLPTFAISDHGGNDFVTKVSVSMDLPPMGHVFPIIKLYMETYNTVLPLFHAKSFLNQVYHFYNLPLSQRDPVVWAAINVVLALAHQHDLVDSCDTKHNTELLLHYLEKAQSVLSTIVLGDTYLLNIQVLVGMVLLIQTSHDLTHALVLLGTTLRLAHKMRLHDRTASMHLDAAAARERTCVFWIAYILDKDVSLRAKQPSIQLDDDIDLDLPLSSRHMIDGTTIGQDIDAACGIITTIDGVAEMSYLVARVQLAAVEGGVYDYLYSTRSRKRSSEERASALQSLVQALDTWKASIPLEFNIHMDPGTVSTHTLRSLALLHATSLACTTVINQANAWNDVWMNGIHRYVSEGTMPILPPQWEIMVDEARHFTFLLGALPVYNQWSFW